MATDYISREAAKELLSQPITMSMCLSTEECHHKIAQQRIDRYLIESIPAADVRPVVRGKWVWNEAWVCGNPYGSYRCTACSAASPHTSGFCPNCGADMRSTDCTKTATADEEREVLNVRTWLNNGADMRGENNG